MGRSECPPQTESLLTELFLTGQLPSLLQDQLTLAFVKSFFDISILSHTHGSPAQAKVTVQTLQNGKLSFWEMEFAHSHIVILGGRTNPLNSGLLIPWIFIII